MSFSDYSCFVSLAVNTATDGSYRENKRQSDLESVNAAMRACKAILPKFPGPGVRLVVPVVWLLDKGVVHF